MAVPGFITVTPLGADDLHFRSMTGSEEMGRPFEYVVEVLSKNSDINLYGALGQQMTVSVQFTETGTRYFNGYITRFSQVGMYGNYYAYRAVLHPWLWFLNRFSDCRVFQNKSVPDIVGKIFRKYDANVFRAVLENPAHDHPAREYTVQYRETDLTFIGRLLEEAGISYHFVHDEASHTLVLTDSIGGREPQKGYEQVPLRPAAASSDIECLTAWHASEEVKTAAYMLRDFDYMNPGRPVSAKLELTKVNQRDLRVMGEFYDYPGRFLTQDTGNHATEVRLQEAQSMYGVVHASGNTRGIGVGNVFTLVEAPFSDPKVSHLVVRARYELRGHDPESGSNGTDHDQFSCALTLVRSDVPFRPARHTPRPVVQGPQTAIVVGPDKDDDNPEEIWTDDLGRVLVRFHWERVGEDKPKDPERADDDKANREKACWVRVASLWAGKQWGVQFTPRIGQEVMVEFLEGDPDRPIVTGRVYNNLNKPPYSNQKKTQSGIKTHSTKGGGPDNFNEIRFEDKKGEEELFVQAERNHTVSVKADRSVSVGGNESISVTGTRTTTITKKDTVTVNDKHEMTVKDLVTETFNNGHTLTVNAANQKIVVAQTKNEHISKNYELTTDIKYLLTQGGTTLTFEGGAVTLKAAAAVSVESPKEIKLTVGGSSITIAPDHVEIKAANVTVTGNVQTAIAGGPATVTVHGAGVDVTGAIIKMNG